MNSKEQTLKNISEELLRLIGELWDASDVELHGEGHPGAPGPPGAGYESMYPEWDPTEVYLKCSLAVLGMILGRMYPEKTSTTFKIDSDGRRFYHDKGGTLWTEVACPKCGDKAFTGPGDWSCSHCKYGETMGPTGASGASGPNDYGYINIAVRKAAEQIRFAIHVWCEGHYPHTNARDIDDKHPLVVALCNLSKVDETTAPFDNCNHDPTLFEPHRPSDAAKHRWDHCEGSMGRLCSNCDKNPSTCDKPVVCPK